MYSSFAWFVLVNQKENIHLDQAPVVQMLDSTIQQISIWDKYLGNQLLHYPLDRDFSIGQRYPPFEQLSTGVTWGCLIIG